MSALDDEITDSILPKKEKTDRVVSKIISCERKAEGAGILSVAFGIAAGGVVVGSFWAGVGNSNYSEPLLATGFCSLGLAGALRVASALYSVRSSAICTLFSLEYDPYGKKVVPYRNRDIIERVANSHNI